jgi:hypothetical protein
MAGMGGVGIFLAAAALPLVGAPRLTARLSANGSPGLRIRIPRPPLESREVAHAVLLEIRVANRGATAIRQALLDLRFPAGHGLTICDQRGEAAGDGELVSAAADRPPLDRWRVEGVTIGGRSERLFHFFLRLDEPGSYPLTVQISSADLREELVVDGTLQAGRADGERSPDETISALIDQGEAIAGHQANVISGGELHREAGAFVLSALVGVLELERPDLRRRLDDAVVDHTGSKTGDDYLRALVRSKLRALYDIRRQLDAL